MYWGIWFLLWILTAVPGFLIMRPILKVFSRLGKKIETLIGRIETFIGTGGNEQLMKEWAIIRMVISLGIGLPLIAFNFSDLYMMLMLGLVSSFLNWLEASICNTHKAIRTVLLFVLIVFIILAFYFGQ